MRKNKKSISFLLIIVLLGLMINFNFAKNDDKLNDTCALTQSDYEKKLNNETMDINKTSEDIIQEMMEIFISVYRAKVRDNESYDFKFLIKPSKLNDTNILYRIKTNEYEGKYKNLTKRRIEWNNIQLTNFNVKIEGTTAIASIIENYQYYVNDDFNTVCNSIKEYTMTFENIKRKWQITSIKTNDPWELEENFTYQDFDIDKELELKSKEIKSWEKKLGNVDFTLLKKEPERDLVSTSSFSPLSYNNDLAAAYAEKWYDGINPDFGKASEDCQNFASQCVWAGFGGEEGVGAPHLTDSPVVYDSTYGSSNSRSWEHNNYYNGSNGVLDWHWDNVGGFAHYIDTSYYGLQGPFGAVVFNLNYANKGDVIDIDWDSTSPTINTLNHAMFVTKVTGTFGSRNPSNIFIAAHNNKTSSAYMPLIDYTSKSESHFATVRIFWGYY